MKKLNIFLLSITLLFASCSIISNPTEENNTKDNLALFTLNIGNSARTIYAAEYTEADLTDIKVTFTSKDTNKTVTALPTENAFSWRIPEGTYTVNVTANAKGYKLAGSASGVKVTKAEGGKATIRLSPSYEGFGNIEIKFLEEKENRREEFITHNNDGVVISGNGNGNPISDEEDNDSKHYLAELKSVTTNQKYRLKLTNNGNGKTAKNNEPIPAGLYTITYANRYQANDTPVTRYCLPDELIEVINEKTTTVSYYRDEMKYIPDNEMKPVYDVTIKYQDEVIVSDVYEYGDKIDLSSIVGSEYSLIDSYEWTSFIEDETVPQVYDDYIIVYSSGILTINELSLKTVPTNASTALFIYQEERVRYSKSINEIEWKDGATLDFGFDTITGQSYYCQGNQLTNISNEQNKEFRFIDESNETLSIDAWCVSNNIFYIYSNGNIYKSYYHYDVNINEYSCSKIMNLETVGISSIVKMVYHDNHLYIAYPYNNPYGVDQLQISIIDNEGTLTSPDCDDSFLYNTSSIDFLSVSNTLYMIPSNNKSLYKLEYNDNRLEYSIVNVSTTQKFLGLRCSQVGREIFGITEFSNNTRQLWSYNIDNGITTINISSNDFDIDNPIFTN